MGKKVLGADMVLVRLKDGGDVPVPRGEELPDGVDAAEVKRLDGLGVFDEPTKPQEPKAEAGPDPRVAELEAQLAEETARREAAEKAAAEATAATAKTGGVTPSPTPPAPAPK